MSFLSKSLRTLIGVTALCYVSLFNSGAGAAEYRLIIGDSATCSANGRSGSDCVLPVGTTTVSTTSTTTTPSSNSTSSGNSNGDCVVTVWNPCSGPGSATNNPPPPASTTTTAPAPAPAPTPAPAPNAVAGTLDFGSGGLDAGGRTFPINVTSSVTSYPFSVVQGRWTGSVGIVPTSSPFPVDGSEVRMWWSTTQGGSALGAACSGNLGSEGFLYWDQTGEQGYGCAIPNQDTTLFLNVRLCISSRTDTTCSSSAAQFTGATAPVYIRGLKNQI